jgi:transcriptional antiterminator NusG
MLTDETATTTTGPVETDQREEHPGIPPTQETPPAPVAEHTPPAENPAEAVADQVTALGQVPAAEEQAAEKAPQAEEGVPPAAPPEAEQQPNNKHWYVVKVQSGREETIKEAIERKVKIEGLEEFYGQIYIPTEKVTEMRRGKRYTRERKILPGYIMAEVEYNDRILYLFRETSGVGDFVGAQPHSNRPPVPMTQREIDQWMKPKRPEAEPSGKIHHDFEKGDKVRVKDGMFAGMEGEVKDIIEAKNALKVELTIFGRPVGVDLEYWQVEHI